MRLDQAPRAALASYLGHFRHADAHKLTLLLWRRYPWPGEIFGLTPKGQLIPLWEPPSVASFIGQWRKRQES